MDILLARFACPKCTRAIESETLRHAPVDACLAERGTAVRSLLHLSPSTVYSSLSVRLYE